MGLMAASAVTSAVAARGQAQAARNAAQMNQGIAEVQAQDATMRGEQEAQAINRNARQTVGAQRAAYAARGVDLGVGTPADVIDQTDFFGQADAATARSNAAKDAWGYRARGAGFAAEAANSSPNRAAALSLLGSAGSVASSWYGKGKG
jgi:hypothetical protein